MSTSISPSVDLSFRPELIELDAPFTTFRRGHFIKPAVSSQPVVRQLETFEGAFFDMYVVQGLDLDYEEPNAVTELEMEFVAAPAAVRVLELSVELPVCNDVHYTPITQFDLHEAA